MNDSPQTALAGILSRLSGQEMIGFETARDEAGRPRLARSADCKVGKNPPPAAPDTKA